MKTIDPVEFARFINTTVQEAKAILAQEATDEPDIHNGYNYRTQKWEVRTP